MDKRILLLTLLTILLVAVSAFAQETNTTTGPTSNVDIFFVACDTQAVLDFRGVMQSGLDIYYQVYSGASGTGTALTSLRRVLVDGDYAVSQVIAYDNSQTVPLSSIASAKVLIARETDSTRSIYETTVQDLQDGCAQPSNPTVDSSTTASAEATSDPFTAALPSGVKPIRAPGSGFIYPPAITSSTGEPVVVIGARPSELVEVGRTNRPGLIFAECDQYTQANPGLIYDTDNITIFWSWFAKTPQQVQDHINNARYSITLNGQTLPGVRVSGIEKREGSVNSWVFYTVDLGDKWQPGDYGISFKLEWVSTITDGYDDYGPDTANVSINSSCTFKILTNPYGLTILHENPKFPLQAR